MQVTGLYQLTRPEVVRALKLTDEQQTKFRDMQKAVAKPVEELLYGMNVPDRNEKLAKLRAEIDRQIEAVLTDEQKALARELVGERFRGELVIEVPDPEKDKPEK
jgi:Spy/CpxP family protein refolding chaperone